MEIDIYELNNMSKEELTELLNKHRSAITVKQNTIFDEINDLTESLNHNYLFNNDLLKTLEKIENELNKINNNRGKKNFDIIHNHLKIILNEKKNRWTKFTTYIKLTISIIENYEQSKIDNQISDNNMIQISNERVNIKKIIEINNNNFNKDREIKEFEEMKSFHDGNLKKNLSEKKNLVDKYYILFENNLTKISNNYIIEDKIIESINSLKKYKLLNLKIINTLLKSGNDNGSIQIFYDYIEKVNVKFIQNNLDNLKSKSNDILIIFKDIIINFFEYLLYVLEYKSNNNININSFFTFLSNKNIFFDKFDFINITDLYSEIIDKYLAILNIKTINIKFLINFLINKKDFFDYYLNLVVSNELNTLLIDHNNSELNKLFNDISNNSLEIENSYSQLLILNKKYKDNNNLTPTKRLNNTYDSISNDNLKKKLLHLESIISFNKEKIEINKEDIINNINDIKDAYTNFIIFIKRLDGIISDLKDNLELLNDFQNKILLNLDIKEELEFSINYINEEIKEFELLKDSYIEFNEENADNALGEIIEFFRKIFFNVINLNFFREEQQINKKKLENKLFKLRNELNYINQNDIPFLHKLENRVNEIKTNSITKNNKLPSLKNNNNNADNDFYYNILYCFWDDYGIEQENHQQFLSNGFTILKKANKNKSFDMLGYIDSILNKKMRINLENYGFKRKFCQFNYSTNKILFYNIKQNYGKYDQDTYSLDFEIPYPDFEGFELTALTKKILKSKMPNIYKPSQFDIYNQKELNLLRECNIYEIFVYSKGKKYELYIEDINLFLIIIFDIKKDILEKYLKQV